MNCEETDEEKSLLLDAAQCLDDCLIRIYPEEFEDKHIQAAARRFGASGGTINRIATLSDNLRKQKEEVDRLNKALNACEVAARPYHTINQAPHPDPYHGCPRFCAACERPREIRKEILQIIEEVRNP